MPKQSALSKTIDTADQEAQYDASVKRLLSQKIVLAWILRECVNEFKPFSIPQVIGCIESGPQAAVIAVDADELDYAEDTADTQIEGLNTEDSSINEGKIYYDIRFSAAIPGTKEPVQLIINVEAQKNDKTPYPLIKRAIYYVSRMVSAQKNKVFTGSHYENIRKVCSIWILMNVDEENTNSITEYSISEKKLVGGMGAKKSDYDLLNIIMLGLGKADGAKGEPILRLLDVLLSAETKPEEKKAILEKDFGIPMSTEMDEEANIMCNLGEGIREKTERRTKAQAVIDLMDSMGIDIEKAMQLLKINSNDREAYRESVVSMLAVK